MSKSNPFALDYSQDPPKTGREALARCSALFPVDDLEWKVQTAAKTSGRDEIPRWAQVVCYVSARAIMSRLDEVYGMDWHATWEETAKGIRCTITAKDPETGAMVARSDVSEWHNGDNGYKATHSFALKRAAVHFGIGRYLYGLEPTWADKPTKQRPNAPTVLRGKGYYCGLDPMKALPDWAIPERALRTPAAPRQPAPTEARKSEEQARKESLGIDDKGHTAFWRAESKGICIQLSNAGTSYGDVAAWCESIGKGRPSGWPEDRVRTMVAEIITPGSASRKKLDAWTAKAKENA